MKPFFYIFMLIFWGCTISSEEKTDMTQDFWILPQLGEPYENGRSHGISLSKEIHNHLTAWESAMQADLQIDQDSIQAILYTHTSFLKSIEKHAPHVLEELKGIAEGAAIDYQRLLAYNLGEEIYNYCKRPIEHCSTLAKENTSAHIIAYNQDLPPFFHGKNRPLVLQHKNFYVFTLPGNIGISGVSKELAVSCNSLPMLRMNTTGLPLPFMIRKLLEASSSAEAAALIQNIPSAIPQNIILASSEEIKGFEFSGNQVETYSVPVDQSFMFHTNTPLLNTDFKEKEYQKTYCPRYHYLDSLVQNATDKVDYSAEKMKELMAENRPQYPVWNAETYLRFVAVFDKHKQKKPHIILINPLRKNAEILLEF